MGRLGSARERAALVVDDGTLREWDADVVSDDPLRFADTRPYAERLAEARERTGRGESVLTGEATVAGRPVAIVAGEFGFLGGSIGVASGERIARAFERALSRRLPLIALPASGGSRMQEGTLALVQMAKLARAATELRAAGLPYVVCLTDPTTGGVLASWGSLGTVTFALPGALLGFAGPRVVELLTGAPLPDGVQRAETLLAHGHIDAIVAPEELRPAVTRVLAVTAPDPVAVANSRVVASSPAAPAPADAAANLPAAAAPLPRLISAGSVLSGDTEPAEVGDSGAGRDAWAALQHARDRRRPGAEALLALAAEDLTELRGDRSGRADDPGCLTALARVCGVPAVVIAQRRAADGAPPALGPAGYRKARRAIALAQELRLPIVTVVDTPGAELSERAERGGLSAEIAGCLAELGAATVPTIALLIGEGGSGGALALLHADRVVCARNASLGVIAPEGASAILHRDLDHAAQLAGAQGGASWQLLAEGIADVVIPEPAPAHEQPEPFLTALRDTLAAELAALVAQPADGRLAARAARWRRLGAPAG